MKTDSFFDLTICRLASPQDLSQGDLAKFDLIEIAGKYPEVGFVRPTKITWRAYLTNINDPFDVIKSDKLKKNIKKWTNELPNVGIVVTVEDDLKPDLFKKWLTIYRNEIGRKKRANIAIDEDWLVKKKKKGKKVGGVFVYKDAVLFGGNVFVDDGTKLSVGYGVVKLPGSLKINLAAVIDFKCLEYGLSKSYPFVSFGKDTNLYGFHLSAGLFSYKSRLGLTCEPAEKYGYVTTKFVNYAKFDDTIIFLTKPKSESELTILYKSHVPVEKEYMANGISRINLTKIT